MHPATPRPRPRLRGLVLVAATLLSAAAAASASSIFSARSAYDDLGLPTLERRAAANSSASSSSSSASTTWRDALHLATDYYPSHWDRGTYWESDAERMRGANISYVRIGEFDWALFEPADGVYDWSILDDSFELLHSQGIKVILGTPAEAPPLWAVQKYDILPADGTRDARRFGSRHHFSFSSPDFRMLNKRIVNKLAERYGNHPALGAWQISNELGCHDTVRTFDKHARTAFQGWLEDKYEGNITLLNELQGRVFWSSQYGNFSDVDVPTQEVTESNPALRLDWFDFSSDQVVSFAKETADAIRAHSKAPITTNFMGYFLDFDHHKLAREAGLDLATYDSYPLGVLETSPWNSDELKLAHMRTGHPDAQSLHFALMRGLTKGRKWGVMEMQPGPVNWATTNPSPFKGMVRLWLHELFAMGASMGNIFRWREVPFAEEQMHAAMNRRDNVPDVAFHEQQQVVADLEKMRDAGLLQASSSSSSSSNTSTLAAGALTWAEGSKAQENKVALLVDYTAPWLLEAEPQGGTWDTNTFTDIPYMYEAVLTDWYGALRRLGVDVDVVGRYGLAPSEHSLAQYDVVVSPTLPIVQADSDLGRTLAGFNGTLVVGPRTASKVPTLSIPEHLPPAKGPIKDRLPNLKVVRVETVRTDGGDQAALGTGDAQKVYNASAWSEWLECEASNSSSAVTEFTFKGYRDGEPASCSHTTAQGKHTHYIGWTATQDALVAYFAQVLARANVTTAVGSTVSSPPALDLGESLRLTRHGNDTLYAINYSGADEADLGDVLDAGKWELVVATGGLGLNDTLEADATKVKKAGVNIYKAKAG